MVSTRDYYELKPQAVHKGLKLCEKYGMGYFVMDSEIWNLAEENPADLQQKISEIGVVREETSCYK